MNLKEYLLTLKDDIPCDACGNCCPNICASKEDHLCIAHPSNTHGEETRGYTCSLTPTEFVVYFGLACKPVGDIIEKITGVKLQTKKRPLQLLEFDASQLKTILNTKI